MKLASLTRKSLRTLPALTAIIVVTIASGCSAGCSASVHFSTNGNTYHHHGVSFKIPNGWSRLTDLTTQANAGNAIWSEGFAPESGSNLVGITAYATKLAITEKNADTYAPDIAAAIKRTFASGSGRVLAGPARAAIANMIGYRFQTTYVGSGGETLASSLFLVWNGHTEYFFNCQHGAGASESADIERGCKTITSTFKLG